MTEPADPDLRAPEGASRAGDHDDSEPQAQQERTQTNFPASRAPARRSSASQSAAKTGAQEDHEDGAHGLEPRRRHLHSQGHPVRVALGEEVER